MFFKHPAKTAPSLSILLIVLNEENMIKQWLDHIKIFQPFEVVIVDGGSTDRTKDLIKEHGSQYNLIEHPMGHSFAEQRNIAKQHCHGDWVLALDADETLSSNSPEIIAKIIQDQGAIAFSFPRVALFPDQDHFIGHKNGDLQLRLYRNLAQISYIYDVHERPAYKGKPIHPGFFRTDQGWKWCKIKQEIKMLHWGHLKPEADLRARGARWQKFRAGSQARGLSVGEPDSFVLKKDQVKYRLLKELF